MTIKLTPEEFDMLYLHCRDLSYEKDKKNGNNYEIVFTDKQFQRVLSWLEHTCATEGCNDIFHHVYHKAFKHLPENSIMAYSSYATQQPII